MNPDFEIYTQDDLDWLEWGIKDLVWEELDYFLNWGQWIPLQDNMHTEIFRDLYDDGVKIVVGAPVKY